MAKRSRLDAPANRANSARHSQAAIIVEVLRHLGPLDAAVRAESSSCACNQLSTCCIDGYVHRLQSIGEITSSHTTAMSEPTRRRGDRALHSLDINACAEEPAVCIKKKVVKRNVSK